MRILVTGANGQVGHELLRALGHADVAGARAARVGARVRATGFAARSGRAHARSYEGQGGDAGRAHARSCEEQGGDADRAHARSCEEQGGDAGRAHARSYEERGGDADRAQARSCEEPDGEVRISEIIPATRSGTLEDGTSCERIDLADLDGLTRALDRIAPDLVINAAAYTAVDRAEDEQDLAQRINGDAPGAIGAWAARHGARVVHYSTDYVFDGTATRPYREDDATHPVSVYGRSKLAGEIALCASGAQHLIFCTAWVYAARGHNFLLTMLRLGAERDSLRVVDDQVGAPTPARLIADVTAHAVARWCTDGSDAPSGVYHLVAAGQTSWCGFARAIFERAHRAGLLARVPDVQAIRTADYPTKATRPAWSVLDTAKLRDAFDVALPDWQTALDGVIGELAAVARSSHTP